LVRVSSTAGRQQLAAALAPAPSGLVFDLSILES